MFISQENPTGQLVILKVKNYSEYVFSVPYVYFTDTIILQAVIQIISIAKIYSTKVW